MNEVLSFFMHVKIEIHFYLTINLKNKYVFF